MAGHKAAFLAAFRQTGNVTLAAEAAGVTRRQHPRWLDDDAAYAQEFWDAVEEANDRLELEARRRGVEGVEKPVFGSLGNGAGSGEIGTVRQYSDTLLIFLMKGNNPEKFAERHEVTGKGGGPIKVQHSTNPYAGLTIEEIDQMEAILARAEQRALEAGKEPGKCPKCGVPWNGTRCWACDYMERSA